VRYRNGEAASDSDRQKISAIANSIAWTTLEFDRQSVSDFLVLAKKRPELVSDTFTEAMGLIFAAWDVRIGRAQFILPSSSLICCDPTAKSVKGRINSPLLYSVPTGPGMPVVTISPWGDSHLGCQQDQAPANQKHI
jgi:hypothetical protein